MENYLNICDKLNSVMRKTFGEYNIKTECEIKACPKNFFNYVNSKLKSNNFPPTIYYNEKVGKNSQEICNLFADFFSRNLRDILKF